MNLVCAIVFFITISTCIYAQSPGKASGRVVSADGKAVAGACISINHKVLAQTNDEGYFKIQLLPGRYTVEISYVGASTQSRMVNITTGQDLILDNITLQESAMQLKDVVVTGQYEAQSLKKSVYQIRTITNERIRLRGATTVQQVLSTELGIQFTNDLTLGTSDINLMGISGQRVKILLDGVPLLDRGDTRESLGQVDINMIDHIEIVEGPMSVMYGTDALGGVINLITKKATWAASSFTASLRVQEESAGKQYNGFDGSGTHNQSLNVKWQRNNFNIGGTLSRNNFGGWAPGDGSRAWLPKNQLLGNLSAGYNTQRFNIWYRINAVDEDIISDGLIVPATNTSKDQRYITHRYMHELQGNARLNDKLSFNAAASYTDYSRRTQTTEQNHTTGERYLTAVASEQAVAKFNTTFFRGTALYKLASWISLQPGTEINLTSSTSDRISGSPNINDYAFFASSEISLSSWASIRPGIRHIHNSVYDAPVIPSVNTKFSLSPALDLRLSYARGFRAPSLQELYFNFHDSSHSIDGNPNLKAEYSNSFNGSLAWQVLNEQQVRFRATIGGFHNRFNNFIETGFNPQNPSITTYLNIARYRTVGGTIENTFNYHNLQATLGFYYTGRYNQLNTDDSTIPDMSWTPEVNSNITYAITKWKANVSLFYKYTGKKPGYEYATNTTTIRRTEISAYNMADFTLNKTINHALSLSGGIRNLFDVTRINNTSQDVGGAHSSGGPVPVAYGRSFFLGLNYQFLK
ncbi:TonB-dependent receptor [Mucilaginibacter lacusdianchii]|uniref:TonB-dependent receptor n=1 Tax=Mucilaginibacter lacusdianchii TaxID=2684211 RepID=UPI00131B0F93|nr:TonB-dependent receptor [Mucilaginibacter sp. JXJ CY 39]